jgi:hypothetical protein
MKLHLYTSKHVEGTGRALPTSREIHSCYMHKTYICTGENNDTHKNGNVM